MYSEDELFEFKSFTPVPDMVVYHLGWEYAIIAGIIWRYSQMRDGYCWASQARIAERAGLSRETVNIKIKKLISSGFVEDLTPGIRGKTHHYKLTDLAYEDVREYLVSYQKK